MTASYIDSSAIVKLVAVEPETDALRGWMSGRTCLTSRIATVEVPRALRRKGGVALGLAAGPLDDALRAMTILELDSAIADRAAGVAPATLRSLDAIHLASALSLATELDAFLTYDRRLADAARALGLSVVAPG